MIGTHYYHSHYDDDYQVDSGLHGLLIVDPAHPTGPHYDVDAIFDLAAWKVQGSETENVFTMDGKPFPEAPQLNVKLGQRVLSAWSTPAPRTKRDASARLHLGLMTYINVS